MNMPRLRAAIFAVLSAGVILLSAAPGTERLYLSGRDKDNTVPWKFFCTSGANSGVWTNLPVPSHWDMKGFGTLTYKKDATNAWGERGLYEYDFAVPADWTGKRLFLVFEGVMTDTSAKLNGESVGPVHQGSFYRFKYEVTKLAKFGATNRLEVDVARHSANESVNKAERLADYWVFAGIYRPVYLEAVPQQFISRMAIDAKADGSFSARVFFNGLTNAWQAEAQIRTLDGKNVGEPFAAGISAAGMGDDYAHLSTQIPTPKQWTAETPNLYNVEVRLKRGNEILHTIKQRFGFRTFEVRDGDGLYVNGRKIILKGVNRHSFWPDSGRCLSEKVHRLDIETIKDMNGNAVRMSHYPPDVEFLDLCDELGLYVLDELAGWHNYYDTPTGTRLVEAMVTRDVNHPSILFWDNGNEGGFNTNLDNVFGQFDPQQRRVLHPWLPFSGVNTGHYLAYSNAEIAATGVPMYYHGGEQREFVNGRLPKNFIYMPTEFMHALYDGGAAAGLADYWGMMMSHSNCAGGFIWALVDESVKRPDTGELDSAGNQAPDGIVGPYREREGSFYAIKQLWSPIQVKRETNGTFTVENHYSFTDASECSFVWQERNVPLVEAKGSGFTVWKEEVIKLGEIKPGAQAPLPISHDATALLLVNNCEVLTALRIADPTGRELQTFAWPHGFEKNAPAYVGESLRDKIRVSEDDKLVTLSSRMGSIGISKQTGLIGEIKKQGGSFSFGQGPRVGSASSKLKTFNHHADGENYAVEATFDGELKSVGWRLIKGGWLQCHYTYTATGTNDAIGVLFDYPEQLVKRKRWLGDGPYRVWKNRLGGGTLGVWENDYNNTITGYRDWVYPEFKGFFANVRWLQLETTEGLITVVPENIPYVQVLTPEQPTANLVANTKMNVPQCGLGFMHAIPAMGSKFKGPESTGPQGQPNIGQGEYSGTVSFYFGKLP